MIKSIVVNAVPAELELAINTTIEKAQRTIAAFHKMQIVSTSQCSSVIKKGVEDVPAITVVIVYEEVKR